jgi:hypothetical protein
MMKRKGMAGQPVWGLAFPSAPAPALSLLVSVGWLMVRDTWVICYHELTLLSLLPHLCPRPKLESRLQHSAYGQPDGSSSLQGGEAAIWACSPD